MSSDLVAFIEARLTEDEQLARLAAAAFAGESGLNWEVDDTTYPEYVRPADPVDNSSVAHGAWGMIGKPGIHIARHDPARVLREVEAKRKMLALHTHLRFAHPLNATSKFEADHRPAFDDAPRYVGCERCSYDPRHEEVYPSWWCEHVRLLAAPYADHPDYQAEWAP